MISEFIGGNAVLLALAGFVIADAGDRGLPELRQQLRVGDDMAENIGKSSRLCARRLRMGVYQRIDLFRHWARPFPFHGFRGVCCQKPDAARMATRYGGLR